MQKIMALFLLVSLLPTAGVISWDFQIVGKGELIAAFALPDGGAITILRVENESNWFYELTDYHGDKSLSVPSRAPAGSQVRPDLAIVQACGQWVQMFVQHTTETGSVVYRFSWDLGRNIGLCTTESRTYFPIVYPQEAAWPTH